MENTKTFYTDYLTAATWGKCNLVLCNNITEIDSTVWENMPSSYYEADEVEGYEEPAEIYQWFITDLSKDSKEYQENTFNLLYSYSDLLDCYILCVPHYGTAWDYVSCEVKSNDWVKFNTDKEYKRG